MSEQVKQN